MSNEPVAICRTWHEGRVQHAELWDWTDGLDALPDGEHRLYTHPVDDTALLRQALEALESVYPYTDSLICYASTVDEHPPNAIDGNVRDALTALRERLGEKK